MYKIGVVKYINTLPLTFGLPKIFGQEEAQIIYEYPADLTKKFQNNYLDIALLPTAYLLQEPHLKYFNTYGIASNNKVASVALFSHKPIEEISEIILDYRSLTSVYLTKIILKYYIKKKVDFTSGKPGYEKKVPLKSAALIIGDAALENINNFEYIYDLGELWFQFTKLPFIYALWFYRVEIDLRFIEQFNQAIKLGLENIDEIIKLPKNYNYNLKEYFTNNIVYKLTERHFSGLELYLSLIKNI